MHLFKRICESAALLLVAAVAMSSDAFAQAAPASSNATANTLLSSKIKYVFVIYQENRSFDSYFGTFPGADGLFSHGARNVPGFVQPIVNTDGTMGHISPFRIGPKQFAADLDDVDHSHASLYAKMDVQGTAARMDRFATTEEHRYSPTGTPSLLAKQMGELTMAYEDCDTVPLLWQYANRFSLFDHIFQLTTGPSTPGNLSILGAQTGETQAALHPAQATTGNGNSGSGVPVLNDDDPLWASPADHTSLLQGRVNPGDYPGYGTQINLTYATLPLTLAGRSITDIAAHDTAPAIDLADLGDDLTFLGRSGTTATTPWGWYEEGYDRESTDNTSGPLTASGTHASYVTHHNGPQYFGYIANNPDEISNLHGLGDFFTAIQGHTLPLQGGLFYVKGGYINTLGLKPADPEPKAQKNFAGDDDHPAYSDAEISEAMVAETVNAIARSPYWSQSAIIITWDDSEGDYDHEPPPVRSTLSALSTPELSDGPRVPLILISPYGRDHAIVHDVGDHGSVVKFVDTVFGLTPLANLPDELKGRMLGESLFHTANFGPDDAITPDVTDLLGGFDVGRLRGTRPPLPASDAIVPDSEITTLPQQSGFGCSQIGIVPVDRQNGITTTIPSDFNPRPKTLPGIFTGL